MRAPPQEVTASSIGVDPAAGWVDVLIPDMPIPTPIGYRLQVSRGNQKYSSSSSTRIQMTGNRIVRLSFGTSQGRSFALGDPNPYGAQRCTRQGFAEWQIIGFAWGTNNHMNALDIVPACLVPISYGA